ncbi:transposable element Tcb1 transposase [Trichonephila clavipes]|nr:transposable element Tcb1 transposase [Trichonephila clavipes]
MLTLLKLDFSLMLSFCGAVMQILAKWNPVEFYKTGVQTLPTYTTLVHPVLEYGYQIFQVASPTNLKKLKRVQLSAARIITGLRYSCPTDIHWCAKIKDEVEKLAYQLNEEAERTERPIRRLKTAIRRFSSGRPRGTTPADDRYIVLQARRNRRQTAGEIARHTTKATGRPISRFTVARKLHGGGRFARRPVRCVPLTPAHRRRRSLWCR